MKFKVSMAALLFLFAPALVLSGDIPDDAPDYHDMPHRNLVEAVRKTLGYDGFMPHPDLEIIRDNFEIAQLGRQEKFSVYFPQFNLTTGAQHREHTYGIRPFGSESSWRVAAEGSVVVFNAGAIGNEVRAAEARLAAVLEQISSVEQELALRTAHAFLSTLRERLTQLASRDHFEYHLRILQICRDKLFNEKWNIRKDQHGVETNTGFWKAKWVNKCPANERDISYIYAQKSEAHATWRSLLESSRNEGSAYKAIVDEDPEKFFLDDPEVHTHLDFEIEGSAEEALALAQTSNPQLLVLDQEILEKEFAHKVAKASRWPVVTAIGGIEYGANNDNRGNIYDRTGGPFIGAQVSVPLFDGGLRRSQIGAAAAQVRISENNRRRYLLQLRLDFEKLFTALHFGKKRADDFQKSYESKRPFVAMKTEEFFNGNRDILVDMLFTRTEVYTAEVAHLLERYALQMNRLTVLAATGQLLEKLGIGPQKP